MKYILFLVYCTSTLSSRAQSGQATVPPVNWHLMDWLTDGYPGISLEKAYIELLENKKPLKKIVVAVIDCGLETSHPDLAGMLWINPKEIAGNNMDDDHNGYVDDMHGWNFGGTATHETLECIREYVRLRKQYEKVADTLALAREPQYAYWKQVLAEKEKKFISLTKTDLRIKAYRQFISKLEIVGNYWGHQLNREVIYVTDIKNRDLPASADSSLTNAQAFCRNALMHSTAPDSLPLGSLAKGMQAFIDDNQSMELEEARMVIEKDDPAYYRKKELGDDPYNQDEKVYGNNIITAHEGTPHATNVTGIIAGLRNNGLGGNGITNAVAIMTLKLDGAEADQGRSDEWDKDVAAAIRYAVDNGAQVINMSFGKYLSPQKQWVDEAMKYAEQKDVLIVAGAGNDATDDDVSSFYPVSNSVAGRPLSNFIKVGASTFDSSLVADFSNYGARSVDVFAPGKAIYTTTLNETYARVDGTSFATPIVSGLAALIWNYYPGLSCKQIKYCIEKSAAPLQIPVVKPGTEEKVPFRNLSRSGGIVNAYTALKMAATLPRNASPKAP